MKEKLRKLPGAIEPLGGGAVCLLVGFLTVILTLTSFLFTTGMQVVEEGGGMDTTVNRIYELDESVIYYSDSFAGNLVMLAVCVVFGSMLLPRLGRLRLRHTLPVLAGWTLAVGFLWIFSSQVKPTFDSAYVAEIGRALAEGDYSDLTGDYLRAYPFQLGYIFLCECIYRAAGIFGGLPGTTLILQAANVCFLAAANAGLLLLSSLFFRDRRVSRLAFLLLLLAAQPVISCTFTYGVVPGICFAVWAIALQTLWFKTDKLYYGVLSGVSIGLAVLFKSNNLIVLIALLIVAALRLFKRRQYVKDLALMLAACVFAFGFSPAVRVMYEKRGDVNMGPGMPYVSWIAMGLSESRRAPGWYSNVTSNETFEELGFDPEALSDLSKDIIRERVAFFAAHPQYTRDFFYRKFVSQFNETSYQCIWNNNVRDQYKEKSFPASWVCSEGEYTAKRYMDVFAQLIFVGMLAALLLMLRRRDFTALILPLTVLGGMLFHLLAEGKSQYILPYFMLMIPLAAFGLTGVFDKTDGLFAKWDAARLRRRGEAAPEQQDESAPPAAEDPA